MQQLTPSVVRPSFKLAGGLHPRFFHISDLISGGLRHLLRLAKLTMGFGPGLDVAQFMGCLSAKRMETAQALASSNGPVYSSDLQLLRHLGRFTLENQRLVPGRVHQSQPKM